MRITPQRLYQIRVNSEASLTPPPSIPQNHLKTRNWKFRRQIKGGVPQKINWREALWPPKTSPSVPLPPARFPWAEYNAFHSNLSPAKTTGRKQPPHLESSLSSARRRGVFLSVGEILWNLIGNIAAWWSRFFTLKHLLYLLQLGAFTLFLSHYLPASVERYNAKYQNALILYQDDELETLLNDDILSEKNQSLNANMGGASINLAGINLPGSPQALYEEISYNLEELIYPVYKTFSYELQPGDNISLLSQRHDLSMSTLISINRIKRAKSLQAGEPIQIPNMDGILHLVQTSDTLSAIAEEYNISMGALIDVNELTTEQLPAGSEIFIPGARMSSYELYKVFGNLFIRPYKGRLTSHFGYRQNPFNKRSREMHNGIDIAGPMGSSVKASSDGKVVVSGYHSIYGNYIVLQHPNRIKTLYGHLSKILVRKGQTVQQGQAIGKIGSTGRSTGPHVHFTIFINGRAINPFSYDYFEY